MINAFGRLLNVSSGRIIEPHTQYMTLKETDGLHIHLSNGANAPQVLCRSGTNNNMFCGEKSNNQFLSVTLRGNNNVIFLGPYSSSGRTKLEISGDDSVYYFGAFSTIVGSAIKIGGPSGLISIGDDCMFSARITISNEDGHGIYDQDTGLRINHNRDVKIGNHVWIGRDVALNKGVEIGDGAIVGQRSVVVGKIGGGIYAGVPARNIKQNAVWSRWNFSSISELEKSVEQRHHLSRVNLIRKKIAALNRNDEFSPSLAVISEEARAQEFFSKPIVKE